MKEKSAAESHIYRLLEIKPGSILMILLIIPPVYTFWLFALGKKLLHKQKKSNKTFIVFAIGNIVCFIVSIIVIPLMEFVLPNLRLIAYSNLFFISGFPFYFFFLGTLGMLSKLTLNKTGK